MEKLFSISEVARELGRSVDWLRDAEKRGKLPKARRDLNGWRVYTSADIAKLQELLAGTANPAELMQQQEKKR